MPRDPDAPEEISLGRLFSVELKMPTDATAMSCRNCGTQNEIEIQTEYIGIGTGPGGRPRLGDRSRNVAVCLACGARGYKPSDLKEIRENLAFFRRSHR